MRPTGDSDNRVAFMQSVPSLPIRRKCGSTLVDVPSNQEGVFMNEKRLGTRSPRVDRALGVV